MFNQFRQNRIRARARRWLVRLSAGDVSGRELQRFNQWLSAHPEHRAASLSVASMWCELGLIEDSVLARYPLAALLSDNYGEDDTADEGKKPDKGRFQTLVADYWLSAIGATGILVVAIVASLWNSSPSQPLQYASVIGEVKRIDMEDGSRIVLGPKSNIVVHYDDHERKVRLIDGEAFFSVAKDPQRPFIVSAMNGSITAVGTAFNVHRGHAQVTVTVHEGRVNLAAVIGSENAGHDNTAEKLLAVGQEASFDQVSGISDVNAVDLQQRSQWRFGRMLFSDKPLSEVVSDINRYSTLQVYIAEERLSDIKVNGSFELDQTKALLKAMEKTLPIRVQMTAGDSAVLFYQAENMSDLR